MRYAVLIYMYACASTMDHTVDSTASAHVDAHSETLMLDVVASLVKRGKTVIWIAHKLDTISRVGLVLVLDGGIIVEKGIPSELMRDRSSTLYRLVRPRGIHRFTGIAENLPRANPASVCDADPISDGISPRHMYRGYYEAAKASHLFRSLSAPMLLRPLLKEESEDVDEFSESASGATTSIVDMGSATRAEQTISTAGEDDDDDDYSDNAIECSASRGVHTRSELPVRRAYSI